MRHYEKGAPDRVHSMCPFLLFFSTFPNIFLERTCLCLSPAFAPIPAQQSRLNDKLEGGQR